MFAVVVATCIAAYFAIGFFLYVCFAVKANLTDRYTVDSELDKLDYEMAAVFSFFGWPIALPLFGFFAFIKLIMRAIAFVAKMNRHPIDRLVKHITSTIEERERHKEKLLQEEQERRETKHVADTVDYRTVKNEEKFGLVHSKPRKKFVRDYATNGFGPQ